MSLKLWPKDATKPVEKFVYAAMAIIPAALFLFLQLSAWGVFQNQYQRSVSHAGAGWHIAGFLLNAAAVYGVYLAAKDRQPVKSLIGWIISCGIVAALGLMAYSGFSWYYNA